MKKNLLKIALMASVAAASFSYTSYAAVEAKKVEDKAAATSEQQREEIADRTIWGLHLSPYARATVITAEEKGVEFNHQKIPPKKIIDATGGTAPKEFLEASGPEGKIPAYQETTSGGQTTNMVESLDIMNYLEKTIPENPLRPDASDKAGNEEVTKMMKYAGDVIAPVTHGLLMQKVVMPTFFKKPTDESTVKANVGKLPAIFDKLENDLKDGREWIAKTKNFSLADIAVVSHLMTVDHVGMDLMKEIDAAKHPKLAAYVKKILARPSFQKASAEVQETLKPAAK